VGVRISMDRIDMTENPYNHMGTSHAA
jgi:hypothetical protein